jgi:phage antirepressor YoqD-like protein
MAIPAQSESVIDQVVEQLNDLNTRLRAVEIDVAVIKSNYATKEDIAKTNISISETHKLIAQTESRLIKWFIGTAVTLVSLSTSLAFLVARFVH